MIGIIVAMEKEMQALSIENAKVTDGEPGEYRIAPVDGTCILRPIRL